VVGVRERVLGDARPCPNPVCAHPPGAASTRQPDRRVGVIELDRHLLREAIEWFSQVKADNVMEEQATKYSCWRRVPVLERVVVGIENLRDVLGEGLSTTARVARVEYLKVELLAGRALQRRSLLTVLLL